MCGIGGFVELGTCSVPKAGLVQMMHSLKHRGPDGEGYFYTPEVGLFNTRLAIIDPSEKAHQPMRRGPWSIVFNGEIYNYIELREELRRAGHKFQSDSDTEVLLAAYEEWQEDCLLRLNG